MDHRLEERYVVIKLSKLSDDQRDQLFYTLGVENISTVDCVVIEEDWPEYDPTVNLLWERISGL